MTVLDHFTTVADSLRALSEKFPTKTPLTDVYKLMSLDRTLSDNAAANFRERAPGEWGFNIDDKAYELDEALKLLVEPLFLREIESINISHWGNEGTLNHKFYSGINENRGNITIMICWMPFDDNVIIRYSLNDDNEYKFLIPSSINTIEADIVSGFKQFCDFKLSKYLEHCKTACKLLISGIRSDKERRIKDIYGNYLEIKQIIDGASR